MDRRKKENAANVEIVESDVNVLRKEITRFGMACSERSEADLQQEYLKKAELKRDTTKMHDLNMHNRKHAAIMRTGLFGHRPRAKSTGEDKNHQMQQSAWLNMKPESHSLPKCTIGKRCRKIK